MVSANLQRISLIQVGLRFKEPVAGRLVDLRALDLTGVNMQDPTIKTEFKRVAELSSANRSDPPLFIDLSDSDISGCDLRGYDLSNVVMSGVKAQRAIFIKAIFSDTQLFSADLENADFRNADLYHAKFYEANIKGANFSGALMTHTHGLGLARPNIVVERLGIASTIANCILPKDIEHLREKIQEKILEHKGYVSTSHNADLIEYEDERNSTADQDSASKDNAGKNADKNFFGSDWLRKITTKTD